MSTEEIYNNNASKWVRTEPSSLSDFTARPSVFKFAGDLAGKRVLDLGCGEGYCSREFVKRGAKSVLGVDASKNMIEAAQLQNLEDKFDINYLTLDVRKFDFSESHADLIVAVFLFNYLNIKDSKELLSKIADYLRTNKKAEFIMTVPHPLLSFIGKENSIFSFSTDGFDYFSGNDKLFEGKIEKISGEELPVQMYHKTFEAYFEMFNQCGFDRIPQLNELRVTQEHCLLKPEFFNPLIGRPLHVLYKF